MTYYPIFLDLRGRDVLVVGAGPVSLRKCAALVEAGAKVTVVFYEDKPISVDLPPTVDLKIVETEPGLKGATVSNVTKPAKLETGLVVQVPPFVNEGEVIRVSTTDGAYMERAG